MPELTSDISYTLPSREENGKWTGRFTREADDFVIAFFYNGKGSPSLTFRANIDELFDALDNLRTRKGIDDA